jgi:hypothetical protein
MPPACGDCCLAVISLKAPVRAMEVVESNALFVTHIMFISRRESASHENHRSLMFCEDIRSGISRSKGTPP